MRFGGKLVTGQEQALFLCLANWTRAGYVKEWLKEWEDEQFAKLGFLLG